MYARLKNVEVIDKGERPRFTDLDFYEYSSHVTVFNVYEQDWTTLQEQRLTHLFNDDESAFESKRDEWQAKKQNEEELISNVS